MKKVIFSLALCLTALSGCQKEVTPEITPEDTTNNIEVPCFYASLEGDSVQAKTTMDESNGKLAWGENDALAVFRKQNVSEKYLLDTESTGSAEGKFTIAEDAKTSEVKFTENVAVFPYTEGIVCSSSENGYEVKLTYPAEQTHNTASFANGLYPMVAVSGDENLTFKNVGGALKLQLKGSCKVSTITLTGNNNESIAGEVVVKASSESTPDVQLNGTGKSITLTCTDLVQLNETEATAFYIALPEVKFEGGFTVSVNNTYTIKTTKERSINRSGLLIMAPIEVEQDNSQLSVERMDQKSGYVVPGGKYDYTLKFNTNGNSSFATVKVSCSDLNLDETIQANGSEYVHNSVIAIPSDATLDKTYTVTVTATSNKGKSVSEILSFTVVEGKVYLVGAASISKGKLGKTPAMTQNPENLNEFTTSIWADKGANWFKFVSSTPDWSAKFNFGLNDEDKIINDGGSATIGLNAQGYYKVTFNMATWEYSATLYEASTETAYPEIYITGENFKYLNENGEWTDFSNWSWLKMNPYPGNPHRFYIDIVCYKSVLAFGAQPNFGDGGTFFGIEGNTGWNWVWWEHVSPLVITNTAGSVPQLKEDSRNGEVMRAIIDTHLGVLSWLPASEYSYPTPATF